MLFVKLRSTKNNHIKVSSFHSKVMHQKRKKRFFKAFQPIEARKLNKILSDFFLSLIYMFIIPKEGINVRLRQTKQLIKTNNDVTIMGLVNDLSSSFFMMIYNIYTQES